MDPEQLYQHQLETLSKYPPSSNIYYITSWDELELVRQINVNEEVVVFMWIKKGIAPVKIAIPCYEEMAKKDPSRIWCICDVDRYPPLHKTISIFPTFRTFYRGFLCREFKSGTSRAGIIQDFDRLFAEIADPTYHPPEDMGVFAKEKVETKSGISTAPKAGKTTALAGAEKNVILPKNQSGGGAQTAEPTAPQKTTSTQTLNRPSSAIPQRLDEYMALLTEKGFFKGLDDGSQAYIERYNKAKERFYQTNPQQQQGGSQSQGSSQGGTMSGQKRLEDKSEQINSYGLDKMKIVGEYKWSKTPKLLQISSAGQFMWGLDSHGMTWRWTGTKFEQVQGQLRQISVSYDGQVWGVNFNNDVLTFSPQSGWQQVQGKLKQVSVANADLIWGVTLNDEIVIYKGRNVWEPVVSGDF